MAFTKITSTNIEANTVAGYAEFANFANSLAPKVSSIAITSNTYSVLDDTAVNVGGGFIVVTGSNFQSGASVLIDTTPATAVSYIDNTTLRVQVPARSAASYNLYVVNPDGGTGIKVSGLTYSTDPTWVTASPLGNQLANTAFNVTFSATGASSYSVAAGSTLPAGTQLLANGYFYGTVSIENQTTYSFSVVATDAELQDSSKTFQVTVTVNPPDAYFGYTSLLVQADDVANNSNNMVFVDSSNNAYAVTSSGTPVQGSQNPFGVGNWSNYFDGTGDNLLTNYSSNLSLGSSDFTIECWIYSTTLGGMILNMGGGLNIAYASYEIYIDQPSSQVRFAGSTTNTGYDVGGESSSGNMGAITINTWNHIAVTRSGNTFRGFVNGVLGLTITPISGALYDTSPRGLAIGSNYSTSWGTGTPTSSHSGYISNLRIIKGNALYTTTFTPSTTPLTSVANTSLLTCQSNTFKDSSNNAFALTVAGNSAVERFNPFGINATRYIPSANSGSVYLDGSSHLVTPSSAGAGNFTLEAWVYRTADTTGITMQLGSEVDSRAYMYVASGGALSFGILNSLEATLGGSVRANSWNHIAVCRVGTTITGYVNGISVGTASSASNIGNTGGFVIGARINGTQRFTGYISNPRIIYGTAVYTSNFTPSTTPLTAVTGTQLLLLNNNAGIYDATTQNSVTTTGDAKVRTNIAKYGGGSIYLDGTSDLLSIPHTNSLDLSSGDFTIEAWVYWNSYVAGSAIIAKGTAAYVAYLIYVGDAAGGTEVDFYTSTSGSAWSVSGLSFAINPSLGAWHHLAVTRSGNVYRTFFNGTLANSVTQAGTLTSQSAAPPLVVGKYNAGNTFNGYIDDLRITKGYARYTDSFTPPSQQLSSR
jgi:hypothetical protein